MGSIRDDIRQAFSRGNSTAVQLILINVFVFVGFLLVRLILSAGEETKSIAQTVESSLLFNAPLTSFLLKPWTLFTYGFINNSFFQLLFNGIALYWFGQLIEDFIGKFKVLNIYILGYVFAGLFYLLVFNLMTLTKTTIHFQSLIEGSSAAVYAVMFATITLIPDYELYLFRMFFVKIKYLALLMLALSFLNPTYGVVSLGGAIFGYLYIKMLRIGVDLGSPVETVQSWFSKKEPSQKPLSPKKFSHSTVGKSAAFTTGPGREFMPDQEEVDALLDKISTSGYESLSKDEKERLFLASKNDKL